MGRTVVTFATLSALLVGGGCSTSTVVAPDPCGDECVEAGHCDDGIDNDGDGFLDCEDDECQGDLACWWYGLECAAVAVDTSAPGPWSYRGTFSGGASFASASCGGSGEEAVLAFTAPAAGTYQLDVRGLHFPVVLYVRKGLCLGGELACDPGQENQAHAAVTLKEGQTAVVFIDSSAGEEGRYVLTITPPESPPPPDPCAGVLRCGVGECLREVPRCSGGVPATCQPGQATTEVCDGFDNDCDGAVDEDAGCSALPPDPRTVAPPLDPTLAPSFLASIEFLYTAEPRVQLGVRRETIDPERVAVIHGRALDRAGAPLSGVHVGVHGHPELGWTLTRADGAFDLAVNGGGTLVVDYTRPGYLPAQRQGEVGWHDHTYLADAVLIAPDSNVTTIDLTTATTVQVAEGSQVTDRDGSRRAVVLFPPGTSAELLLPDGTRQPIGTLSVRATEYTVGETGPAAMPAALPPTSAYTYCVELGADEAIAAGAEHVLFSRPVPFYVDNFLHFPIGIGMPVGFYDRATASWVPLDNGIVLAIVGVGASGEAELDLDGDGDSDEDDLALAAKLDLDAAERSRLAELFLPGQSAWRSLIPHFTTIDTNMNPAIPDGTTAPDHPNPEMSKDNEDCCNEGGSIIAAQNQTLGERIPVYGTPYSLVYESSRAPARKGGVDIPLLGPVVPPNITRVDLYVTIAGRFITQSFEPRPNLGTRFVWDGLDVYGREVPSPGVARFQVGYAYPPEYNTITRFAGTDGATHTQVPAREELVLMRTSFLEVTRRGTPTLDARVHGIGGFSLSVHHVLDPEQAVLHEGGAKARQTVSTVVRSIAGPGDGAEHGDGEAAVLTKVAAAGMAVDAAGNVYLADPGARRVRKVDRAGAMTTVAGGREQAPLDLDVGDGGPAVDAGLVAPSDVAVDGRGNLYIVEDAPLSLDPRARDGFGRLTRIRKVSVDGRIETIAGGFGPGCIQGNNVRAQGACLPSVSPGGSGPHLAVDATGHVFIAGQTQVRRVDPDGLISTVAGGDHAGFAEDGRSAAGDHAFGVIDDLVIDASGNLIIADDGNRRIREIDARSWKIRTIAGCGAVCWERTSSLAGVSGPCTTPPGYPAEPRLQDAYRCGYSGATSGYLGLAAGQETKLAVGPAGVVYVRGGRPYARIVSIWAIGLGSEGYEDVVGTAGGYEAPHVYHDGLDPMNENPNDVAALAVTPAGQLLLARPDAVRRITELSNLTLPSSDGGEVYAFDARGRHLETRDALSGAVRLSFAYDDRGYLATVTDADGNVTRIDRDGTGRPTQLVAPGGQVTRLLVDSDGYLTSLTDPAGGEYRMSYRPGGLLATFTDPLGHTSSMTYDGGGALVSDLNAAGGGWAHIEHLGASTTSTVVMTSAGGRVIQHATRYRGGDVITRTTYPGGSARTRTLSPSGDEVTANPDGSVVRSKSAPDPTFGKLAPVVERFSLRLPSGLESIAEFRRERVPATTGPGAARETETITLNGRVSTTVYDGATRTRTETSPEGRQTVVVYDGRQRPLEVRVPGEAPTTFTYRPDGQLETISRMADGQVQTFRMEYADAGPGARYLRAFSNPLGEASTFIRDARGAVTEIASPAGRVRRQAYDAKGNLTSYTPPGRPAHVFVRSPIDLVASYQPPAVDGSDPSSGYTYGLDRQIARQTLPGGVVVERTYDPESGVLTRLSTPEGVTRYEYDRVGRLTRVTGPTGEVVGYEYDGAYVTSVTTAGTVSSAVRISYDPNTWVTETAVTAGGSTDTVTYAYDRDGLLTRAGDYSTYRSPGTGQGIESVVGLVADQPTFDGFGRLSSLSADHDGAPLYAVVVQRDLADRIVQRVETIGGVTTTEAYRYDRDGQLVSVDINGTGAAEYSYDDNGNLRSVYDGANVSGATYDDQDRLLTFGDAVFTHTPGGAIRTRTEDGAVTRYTYDTLGNLVRVELPEGRTVEYAVDPVNRRVGKRVDGALVQAFVYGLGGAPIAELDGEGRVVAHFVFAGRTPAYMTKGGRTYRFITDLLGSVRLVVDAEDGTVAERLDYDAWGRVVRDTAPGFQPFGYVSGLYDPLTGLVRFGARDYDPSLGRWTAKDPLGFEGGDSNLYAYAANDPVNRIDPNGMSDEAVITPAFLEVLKAMEANGDRLPGSNGVTNNLAGAAMMIPWALGAPIDPPSGCHGQSIIMASRLKQMLKDWKFEPKSNYPADASPLSKYRPLSGYHWVVEAVSPSGEVFKLDPNNGVMGRWGPGDAQFKYGE